MFGLLAAIFSIVFATLWAYSTLMWRREVQRLADLDRQNEELESRFKRLSSEMADDREWKAAAVLQLVSCELAKTELLANLAKPFRLRSAWSGMVARLYGSKS